MDKKPADDFFYLLTFSVFAFLLCLYMGYGLGRREPAFWGPPALYLALLAAIFLRALVGPAGGREEREEGDGDGGMVAWMILTFPVMLSLSFVLGAGWGWGFWLPPALFLYAPLVAALFASWDA